MPITPLHIAFAWPLQMKFRIFSFAPLTMGSFVPDIEVPIMWSLGFFPDRLVTHSLIGAVTIDLVLTIILLKFLNSFNLERIGVIGFKAPLNARFIGSAAVGSLSHILIDALHHEYNPLLWPFEPTYFVGPFVFLMNPFFAHAAAHLLAIIIIIFILKKLLNRNGHDFSLLSKDPIKALSLVTNALGAIESKGH